MGYSKYEVGAKTCCNPCSKKQVSYDAPTPPPPYMPPPPPPPPIMATSPQQPLSSIPKVAIVAKVQL